MATPLPEGTITLLFTDIEGSTAHLHRLGDGYATLLADHRAILRAAFAQWNEVSLGDLASGRRRFERSLALTIELGFAWGIAFSLEGLARLAVEEQQPQRALVLAGAAERRRRTVGTPLPAVGRAQMDGLLARARDTLPEADATAAFAHGQRLDDEALMTWLRTEQLLPSRYP